MHWRQQQLEAFENPCLIKQDAELIDYLRNTHVKECAAMGDVEYFNQYVTFVNFQSNFGILVQNTSFQWQDLANTINCFLREKIKSTGILYLAINKYLAKPINHVPLLSDDYDLAIYEFIKLNIQDLAQIKSYSFDPNDQGLKFNFAHPLTRFYLQRL
jgi:hypothetical protein